MGGEGFNLLRVCGGVNILTVVSRWLREWQACISSGRPKAECDEEHMVTGFYVPPNGDVVWRSVERPLDASELLSACRAVSEVLYDTCGSEVCRAYVVCRDGSVVVFERGVPGL